MKPSCKSWFSYRIFSCVEFGWCSRVSLGNPSMLYRCVYHIEVFLLGALIFRFEGILLEMGGVLDLRSSDLSELCHLEREEWLWLLQYCFWYLNPFCVESFELNSLRRRDATWERRGWLCELQECFWYLNPSYIGSFKHKSLSRRDATWEGRGWLCYLQQCFWYLTPLVFLCCIFLSWNHWAEGMPLGKGGVIMCITANNLSQPLSCWTLS